MLFEHLEFYLLRGIVRNWVTNLHLTLFQELPSFIIWGIWLNRNKSSFEYVVVNSLLVAHQIQVSFNEFCKKPKAMHLRRIKSPVFSLNYAWIFFTEQVKEILENVE